MPIVFWDIFVITTARRCMKKLITSSPNANKEEPIYIIEVGAGHGKLGFLILNHLNDLREFMPDGIL